MTTYQYLALSKEEQRMALLEAPSPESPNPSPEPVMPDPVAETSTAKKSVPAITYNGPGKKYHFTHNNERKARTDELYEDKHLADLTLIADNGKEFKVHHVILCQISKYFKHIYAGPKFLCLPRCGKLFRCLSWLEELAKIKKDKVLTLTGITSDQIDYLIKYAYTNELDIDGANIEAVIEMAIHFELKDLIQCCCNFYETQILNVVTFAEVWNLAERLSLHRLEERTMLLVCDSLPTMEDKYLMKLNLDQFGRILSCGYAINCAEGALLEKICRWIDLTTKPGVRDLFPKIHLKEVEPQYIKSSKDLYPGVFETLRLVNPTLLQELNNIVARPALSWDENKLQTKFFNANSRRIERTILRVGRTSTIDLTYYCRISKEWKQLAKYPRFILHFLVATEGTKLYTLQFNPKKHEKEWFICYDAKLDVWTTLANHQLHYDRESSVCVVNGKVYALGGALLNDSMIVTRAARLKNLYIHCECYDPSDNKWSRLPDMPGIRSGHASVAYKNLIFVSGGVDANSLDVYGKKSIIFFDTNLKQWKHLKGTMHTGRFEHSMIANDDKLYVYGGLDSDYMKMTVFTVEEYDIRKDRWRVLGQPPVLRDIAGFGCLFGQLYVIGGKTPNKPTIIIDKGVQGVIDVFDLETEKWETILSQTVDTVSPVFLHLSIPLNFQELYRDYTQKELKPWYNIQINESEPEHENLF